MQILHKDSLPLGGFAGLKEHRLVVDKRIGGRDNTWDGLGNFVYFADAYFDPYGETNMHSHHEIDIISIVVEGKIQHEGSLEHGQALQKRDIQVQRAGAKGFSHNEVNPNPNKNRMIQMWVLPESEGEETSYKLYKTAKDELQRIYGGLKSQNVTLNNSTHIEVGSFSQNKEVYKSGDFMTYITKGKGILNQQAVKEGDLIRGTDFQFKSNEDNTEIILISTH